MSNPFKDEFDRESLIKDIAERADIIVNYQKAVFWIGIMLSEKFWN